MKVESLPSLNDRQVFVRSSDLLPENVRRTVILKLQAAGIHFTRDWRFLFFEKITEISLIGE